MPKSDFDSFSKSFQGLSCKDALVDWANEDLVEEDGHHSGVASIQAWRQPRLKPIHGRSVHQRNSSHFLRGVSEWSTQIVSSQSCNPKQEIEQSISQSLREWGGVDYNSLSRNKFFHQAKEQAIVTVFGNVPQGEGGGGAVVAAEDHNDMRNGKPRPQKLPTNVPQAIKFVLEDLIRNSRETCYRIDDKISNIYSQGLAYEPYFENSHGMMKLKNVFERVAKDNPALLHPFNRFYSCKMNKREYFHWLFFEANTSLLAGYIFEAIVASYAINGDDKKNSCNIFCQSCGCPNSLRWMGGPTSPWTDLLCVECNSTYEIKSKESIIQIENQLLKYNSIQGGSFTEFHCLKRKLECPNTKTKHYVVLVSRTAQYWVGSNNDQYWQASIAEIDTVLPRFKDKSFVATTKTKENTASSIPLGSKIKVKRSTIKPEWFSIPYVEIDHKNLAKRVFDDLFKIENIKIDNINGINIPTWYLPLAPKRLARNSS